MAGKLAETANINGGTIANCAVSETVTIAVDLSGSKTPAYWRALGVGRHGPFRMTRADAGAPGSSVSGTVTAIVKSLDTGVDVVLKYDEDEGTTDYRRVSTDETNWAAWRPVGSGALEVVDIADAGTLAQQDADDVSVSKLTVSQGSIDHTVEIVSTVEGMHNLQLEADHNGSTGAILGLSLSTSSPAIGDDVGQIYFTASGTTYALLGGEIQGAGFGSFAGRFTFHTVDTTGGAIARAYIGLGLYTANTSDNGADSVTSKTHYLKAAAAPSSPAVAGSWALYVDSGDSNKLKAKHSTGTVVTLGTP
jgi:hypothetical protein